MRLSRAALIGAVSWVGCSSADVRFQLSDVERLSVGESTREEVEHALGAPASWSAHTGIHQNWRSTPVPGPPFSFVVWPIYFGRTVERCTVSAWYDSQNILSEGTVTLDAHSFTDLMMFFRIQGCDYPLDERLIDPLQRVERKGFRILIAEGDRRRSLQRFLDEMRIFR